MSGEIKQRLSPEFVKFMDDLRKQKCKEWGLTEKALSYPVISQMILKELKPNRFQKFEIDLRYRKIREKKQ